MVTAGQGEGREVASVLLSLQQSDQSSRRPSQPPGHPLPPRHRPRPRHALPVAPPQVLTRKSSSLGMSIRLLQLPQRLHGDQPESQRATQQLPAAARATPLFSARRRSNAACCVLTPGRPATCAATSAGGWSRLHQRERAPAKERLPRGG